MTGMYVRVLREGTPQSLEIDTLTDTELADFFAMRDPEQIVAATPSL
jgi:hypothetical protein